MIIASSDRVQIQQGGRVVRSWMTVAKLSKRPSKIASGPIRSIVVSITFKIDVKLIQYEQRYHTYIIFTADLIIISDIYANIGHKNEITSYRHMQTFFQKSLQKYLMNRFSQYFLKILWSSLQICSFDFYIQIYIMQITGVLQPPRRNKQLNEKEIANMKRNLQKLSITPQESVYYSIVTKDSKTGFFSNDRLLLLATRERQVSYLSKLPEGLLPFLNEQQVKSLKPKTRISRSQVAEGIVRNFKCAPIPGKVSTFQIYFKRGQEEQTWVLLTGNSKTMSDWVELINNYLLTDPAPPPQQLPQQNIQISDNPNNPPSRITRPLNQNPLQTQTQPALQKQPDYSLPQSVKQPEPGPGYSDHVTELRYLRGKEPERFITNNELSRTKLRDPDAENNLNNGNMNQMQFSKAQQPYEITSRLLEEPQQRRQMPISSRIQQQSDYQNTQFLRNKAPEPVEQERNFRKNRTGLSRQQQEIRKQPSRRQFDRLAKPEERAGSGEKSAARLSGFISNSRQSRNQQQLVKQRQSRGEQENSRSYKNIIIREDSKDDLRGIRKQPSRASSKAQSNFASKGALKNTSGRSLRQRKWNQLFAESANKLKVYQEFIESSYNAIRAIVNELPLPGEHREFVPIEVKPPYYTYYNDGILITLLVAEGETVRSSANDAPLLFQQSSYHLIKRQFYNYNLLLGVTGNEGFIKVPASAYFEYKGVIITCKAEIPEGFVQASPNRYEKQLDIIENQTHVRFLYGGFSAYLHPQGKYLLLDNLNNLIPALPNPLGQQFFRKQFLLVHQQELIQDAQAAADAHILITQTILPDLISSLQALQGYILCSSDLLRVFHQAGVSLGYLPQCYRISQAPYLRRVFSSQMTASILSEIFRSELCNLQGGLPEQLQQASLDAVNRVLLQSCQALLELTFGYSNAAQSIWKVVVEQCHLRYQISISKEDVIPGYLFSALLQRLGLICDFRRSAFDKHAVQFFVRSGNIPKDLLVGFKMKVRRYDLSAISPIVREVEDIIISEPSSEGFKGLLQALDLRKQAVPSFLQGLEAPILTYLCNFVGYSQHEQFQHAGIYNSVVQEPHTYWSMKASLLAIKWCIKKRLPEEALRIYHLKQTESAFWAGEHNPALVELTDFLSMYHASLGRYEEAVGLAKQSLRSVGRLLGPGALPVADKHYQLGNIYFKMGRKQDALREYSRTRDILSTHGQRNIAEYGVILLKLSVLLLNFGKISDCVNNSLQALDVFQKANSNQQDQIGTFEILARCYEITKKDAELQRLAALVGEQFNKTEDPLIFQRMAKISLYPRIRSLSSPEGRAFAGLISKLEGHSSQLTSAQAFTFLHRKASSMILVKRILHLLDNIISLYEQSSKKDLFRRYKSLDSQTRTEAEQLLVTLDALAAITGFGFLLGALRDQP